VTQKVVLSEEERREKKLQSKRDSHARHKERNNARSRAYYLAHKEQQAQRMAEWRNANKEKIRHLNAKYRKNNKDKCRKNKESWRKNNPDKVRVIQTRYAAKKLKACPVFCLKNRMRVRMCQAIRSAGVYKTDRTLALIGCTSKQLKKHIESKFLPGMTWSNRRRWHVDHIVPIAAFDISTEEGQRAAFHYTNLQPLWAKDNLKKAASRPPDAAIYRDPKETATCTPGNQ
jgi:hypothetical protein